MFKFIQQYTRTLVDEAGRSYAARVYGQPSANGAWTGWITFFPLLGGKPVSTDRETSQPNRGALDYWASGLSPTYLEGALKRAIDLLPESKLARLAARAERDAARAVLLASEHQAAAKAALEAADEAEDERDRAQNMIDTLGSDSPTGR